MSTLALMVLGSGASADDGAVGTVQVDSGSLSVFPVVSYAGLQVSVSGGDVYWQRSYSPGEAASATLAEIGALSDGSYNYEVIAAPEVDEAAWAAADGNDARERELEGREMANTFRQSGGFEVASGQVKLAQEKASNEQVSQAHSHDDAAPHTHN